MKEAPPLTPRALKVIRYFKFALLAALGISGFGIFHAMESAGFHPQDHWSWIPIYLVITFLSTKLIYNLLVFAIVMSVYKGDFELMEEECEMMAFSGEEEDPTAPLDEIDLTIVKTAEKPVGHYLDAPIYEWIEFTNEAKQKIIGEFIDVVDMTKKFTLPEDSMVVAPGIVFKLKLVEQSG